MVHQLYFPMAIWMSESVFDLLYDNWTLRCRLLGPNIPRYVYRFVNITLHLCLCLGICECCKCLKYDKAGLRLLSMISFNNWLTVRRMARTSDWVFLGYHLKQTMVKNELKKDRLLNTDKIYRQKKIHEGGTLVEFNHIQCYRCTLALRNAVSSMLQQSG